MKMSHRLGVVPLWLAGCLALAACGEEPPAAEIVGGGFIFNYRLAEAHWGIVATVAGDVPAGAMLEAAFEDPAGGPAIVIRHPVEPSRSRYKLETPPLSGIRADHPYPVTLRVLAPGDGGVLAEARREFRSGLAQDALPERPLTVGPGYPPPPPAGAEKP